MAHLKLSTPNIAKVWVSAMYLDLLDLKVEGVTSTSRWKSFGGGVGMVGPARLAENPAGNPVVYLALLKMCVFFPILEATRNGESTRNRFHLCGPAVANPRSSFKIQEIEKRATTWLRNSAARDNIESNQRTRWEFQTFLCFQPKLGWLVEMKIFFWIGGSSTTRKGRYCYFSILLLLLWEGCILPSGKLT